MEVSAQQLVLGHFLWEEGCGVGQREGGDFPVLTLCSDEGMVMEQWPPGTGTEMSCLGLELREPPGSDAASYEEGA